MEKPIRVTDQRKSLWFATSAVLIWSTVATAFKLALRDLDYVQLIFVASGISLAFLFCYLLLSGQFQAIFQSSAKEWLHSALLGAFNPFAYYLILFKAYSLLPAQLAQPLNMVWPLTLALLSVPLLHQRITWRQFMALGICFAGIVVLSSQGSLRGFRETNLSGVVLAVGSSIFWALYWILNVKDRRNEAVKLFLNFFFGFLYLLILLPVVSDFHFEWNVSLGAAIYVGLFEAGITYILWMKAMQYSENNALTGSLTYASPFISLFFISAVLGEKIHLTTIAGLALIVTGIVYQQIFNRK